MRAVRAEGLPAEPALGYLLVVHGAGAGGAAEVLLPGVPAQRVACGVGKEKQVSSPRIHAALEPGAQETIAMRGLIELPLEDTVDVHTAARIARVSDSTMRRWCDEGRVPACKPVGRWRIYRSELVVWIKSSNTLPVTPRPRQFELFE